MDADHVGGAVAYMASLPLDANVLFMTVMATKMPFVGRGWQLTRTHAPLVDSLAALAASRPPRLRAAVPLRSPSTSSSPMRPGGTGDVVARIIAEQARAGARADRGGGEPRGRERRDRRHVGGQCAARRPHAARRANRRDGGQPVLDEGTELRSAGVCADRARDRRAARARRARRRRPTRPWPRCSRR